MERMPLMDFNGGHHVLQTVRVVGPGHAKGKPQLAQDHFLDHRVIAEAAGAETAGHEDIGGPLFQGLDHIPQVLLERQAGAFRGILGPQLQGLLVGPGRNDQFHPVTFQDLGIAHIKEPHMGDGQLQGTSFPFRARFSSRSKKASSRVCRPTAEVCSSRTRDKTGLSEPRRA